TNAVAQNNATTITGRVTGTTSAPIASAVLTVEGTQLTASSDAEGRYSLTVPAGHSGSAKVLIRRIGFEPQKQEVKLVGTSVALNFTLQPAVTELTGVVVTALSVQREKSSIGTSQQA